MTTLLAGVCLLMTQAQAGFLDDALQGLKNKAVEAAKNHLEPGAGGTSGHASDQTTPNAENPEDADSRARSTPSGTNAQDPFIQNRLPVGTEVRIQGTAIQRILSAPALSAEPVVACDSNVSKQTSLGPNQGRFLIEEYATSLEVPGTSLRRYSNRYPQEFTAHWARVQHVKIKSHVAWLTFRAETCSGWVRVDAMDTYHGGTGEYRFSRLKEWNESTVPSSIEQPDKQVTVKNNGFLYASRSDSRRPICMIKSGDIVQVLEPHPTEKVDRTRVLVIRAQSCPGNNIAGYLGLNLLGK